MKQDRSSVRTAAELERKYDLRGQNKGSNAELEERINTLNQTLYQYMAVTNTELSEKTGTHFGSGVPSLLNKPAVNWDEEEKAKHVGDIYCDIDTGYIYLFRFTDNIYEWFATKSKGSGTILAAVQKAETVRGNSTITVAIERE